MEVYIYYKRNTIKKEKKNIKALGYKVLRFSNEEVLKRWDVVEIKIREFSPIFACVMSLAGQINLTTKQNLKDEIPMMQTSQTNMIKSWGFHPLVPNRTSLALEIKIKLNT